MSQPQSPLMPRSHFARLASIEAEKAATPARRGTDAGTPDWLLDGVVWQHCLDCKHVFFPARPLCPDCLSEHYEWRHSEAGSSLVSFTNLHVSFSDLFARKGPWNIGLVAHPEGPEVFVFLAEEVGRTGDTVSLFTVPDATGQAVFVAVAPGGDAVESAAKIAAGLAAPAD